MVKIEEIKDDPMEMLLGSELIRDAKGKTKLATTAALKGKKLVLLYFSASWYVKNCLVLLLWMMIVTMVFVLFSVFACDLYY